MTATAERPVANPKRRARLSREQAVLDLLETAEQWQPFIGPTGKLFWRVPGSKSATYTVSPDSCTCPYEEHRPMNTEACKHRRTVQLYMFVGQMFSVQLRTLEPDA